METMIDKTVLIKNGQMVNSLYSSTRRGGAGLNAVPGLLRQIIGDGMWRAFVVEQTNEIARYDRFVDFVNDEPPEGLGATIDLLLRMCKDNDDVINLIDIEIKRPPGDHKGNQYTLELDSNGTLYNIQGSNIKTEPAPTGTSQQAALRRLRSEIDKAKSPEKRETIKALQRQVFNHEISAHRAMVLIGARRETFTIPVDPERAGKAIKKRFSSDQLDQLIAILSERIS